MIEKVASGQNGALDHFFFHCAASHLVLGDGDIPMRREFDRRTMSVGGGAGTTRRYRHGIRCGPCQIVRSTQGEVRGVLPRETPSYTADVY